MYLDICTRPFTENADTPYYLSIDKIIDTVKITKNSPLKFLKHVRIHDVLRIETLEHHLHLYKIIKVEIAHKDICQPNTFSKLGSKQVLELVTHYPFDSLSLRGPLRYKISARPLS